MARLVYKYFSGSGSWVAPAGVTRVWVLGHGGGMGGPGGSNQTFDSTYCASSTSPYMVTLTVVPNTSYTITIGAGGSGGPARTSSFTNNGGAGGNTTFGSLHTFPGATTSSTGQTMGITTKNSVMSNGDTGAIANGYVQHTYQAGAFVGSYSGGYDGLGGYVGSTGGARGAGVSSGTGVAGGNASGFGAGGGGGGCGPTAGGVGGTGAPGQLWVAWIE